MKKLQILALLASACFMPAFAQDEPADEWEGIGTGAYQPGLLNVYADEYTEIVEAAVYKSTQREEVYKFVPTNPGGGKMPYEVIVHAENPEKVWMESTTYFHMIFNYSIYHLVNEGNTYGVHDDLNYGKLEDGKISFTRAQSFAVLDGGLTRTNLNGKFALYMPGEAPGGNPVEKDTWKVLGMGKYVEGLLDCEYTAGVSWDVEIEESEEHPGNYRLKPYFEGNPSCPNLPEVADTYLYVNAEDEMEVYTYDMLILNNMGRGYKLQHRAVATDNPDASYFGTLEDGVITFPVNSHVANVVGVAGMDAVLSNTSGKASIVLPGGDFKDWYVNVKHTECAQGSGDGFCRMPMTITAGADVAGVAVVVEAGNFTSLTQEQLEAYVAQGGNLYPREFFGMQLNMVFPVVKELYNTNRWTLIAIAVDSNYGVHGYAASTFFTPENDSDWQDYAEVEFRDILLSEGYFTTEATYDLVMQQKKGTEGMFRLVNPYAVHPAITAAEDDYVGDHKAHNHYLYIDATDPEYVYVEESAVGLDFGFGAVIGSSLVGSMLNERMTLAEIKELGIPAGRFADDEIVFAEDALCFVEQGYDNGVHQGASAGTMVTIKKLITNNISTLGDESVVATEYYNMQGMRVQRPEVGGLYIVKEGNKTYKQIKR